MTAPSAEYMREWRRTHPEEQAVIDARNRVRRHPLSGTWNQMKQRCYNPNNNRFHLYGGRGIRVCERWRTSFANFIADMGPKPSPQHSIDRYPNNDGDYKKSNCRWATPEQQRNNRRE